VGSLRLSPELPLIAVVVVPRREGSFDEVNSGGSNFALQRTAKGQRSLADGSARRR
jgi:hypothetical protein